MSFLESVAIKVLLVKYEDGGVLVRATVDHLSTC